MSPPTVATVAGDCLERVRRPYEEMMAALAFELGRIGTAGRDGSLTDLAAAMDELPDMFAALAVLRVSLPSRETLARRVVNGTASDLRALRTAYLDAAEHDRTATPLRAVPVGSGDDPTRFGYFEAKLTDGTWGSLQRRPDDCARAGLATLLQCPMHMLPKVYPADLRSQGKDPEEVGQIMAGTYGRWMERKHVQLVAHTSLPTASKRWLGLVGEGESGHYVLFRKREMVFDTAWVTPPRADRQPRWSLEDVQVGFTIE